MNMNEVLVQREYLDAAQKTDILRYESRDHGDTLGAERVPNSTTMSSKAWSNTVSGCSEETILAGP